jgi:predicted nucleic acid-binding protein
VSEWVVNASPLVFLGNAGRLELLREVSGGRVIVPAAVFREVTASSHCDRASRAVEAAAWIERANARSLPQSVVEWDLGAGESEVIALATERRSTRVVIDDLAGRKCGLSHGLDVIGTIGVVVAAHRKGLVADPADVFSELRAAGMWLSDSVVARALALAQTTK